MYAAPSGTFHDYATTTPPQPVADHSLATDLRVFTSSPNSLTMYEQENVDLPCSLPSTSSDGLNDLGSLDDFDLKPQFECNSDNLLKFKLDSLTSVLDVGNRGDPVWSPTEAGLLKMEDVFQVDKSDVIQGPTLAALNNDDSFSVFDDMSMMGNDLDQLGMLMNSSCWKSSPASSVFNFPIAVSPTKSTTCTITSTSLQTVDTVAVQELCKVNPPIFSVTAKVSCMPMPQKTVSAKVLPPAPPCGIPLSPLVDSKSHLQQLLRQPLSDPDKIPSVVSNIKVENVEPTVEVQKKSIKRSLSPRSSSDTHTKIIDRKWEEIKQFIYNDEAPTFNTTPHPIKKVKLEPPDGKWLLIFDKQYKYTWNSALHLNYILTSPKY